MICDTSFFIDVLRNYPNAVNKAKVLEQGVFPLHVTSVTVFELWRGMHRASEEKKRRLQRVLDRFGLLVLDWNSAKIAAEIYAELRNAGREIEVEDCLIAGIALEHNEPILTRNAKHFSRIKGLRVETY